MRAFLTPVLHLLLLSLNDVFGPTQTAVVVHANDININLPIDDLVNPPTESITALLEDVDMEDSKHMVNDSEEDVDGEYVVDSDENDPLPNTSKATNHTSDHSFTNRQCSAEDIQSPHDHPPSPTMIYRNYTTHGIHKVRSPSSLLRRLAQFWSTNYINTTEPPHSSLLDINDYGGGQDLRNRLWTVAQNAWDMWLREDTYSDYPNVPWKLHPVSLYGVKVYTGEGMMVANHWDGLPLVCTAVIHVASDLEEDWPLEVHAHNGKVYNMTMQPGDMILYEGHSVLHGRPYPLQGRYYANVYIHFEPTAHSMHHDRWLRTHVIANKNGILDEDTETGEQLYRRAMSLEGPVVDDTSMELDLPEFVVRGTLQERRWRQQERYEVLMDTERSTTGIGKAHTAASTGDYETLQTLAANHDTGSFHSIDSNGWQPLHEAARAGHTQIVDLLLAHGVDYDARTNNGKGGTALWWASKMHGEEHPVTKKLKGLGALDIAPGVDV